MFRLQVSITDGDGVFATHFLEHAVIQFVYAGSTETSCIRGTYVEVSNIVHGCHFRGETSACLFMIVIACTDNAREVIPQFYLMLSVARQSIYSLVYIGIGTNKNVLAVVHSEDSGTVGGETEDTF